MKQINKVKEGILDKLKGKTPHKLAEEYIKAEKKLLKSLEGLESWGDGCNCDNQEVIEVVANEWEFESEVSFYCLNCGGFIEE